MHAIAVTGATGYVGQCLVQALRARGHTVYELSRTNRRDSAAWIRFDLRRVEELRLPADVDWFVHAAHDFSGTTWKAMDDVNIKGTIRLFDRVKAAGCPNAIFISSLAAFDAAVSDYGRAKRALEKALLPEGVICVRPGLVYGAGGGLVEAIRKQVRKRKIVPLVDGGKQKLYLVSTDSLGSALVRIVDDPEPFRGRPVVVAARKPTTVRALAMELATQSQVVPWFLPVPGVVVAPVLRLLEKLTARVPFRSDSIVGLRTQCREPFEGNSVIDVESDVAPEEWSRRV